MTELNERFSALNALANTRRTSSGSKKRIAVGSADVLRAAPRENFEQRWVVDKENRLEMFANGGWSVVKDQSRDLTGERPQDSSRPGSAVNRASGPNHLILMEIPKKLFDKDQAVKQEKIRSQERAMERNISKDDAEDHGGQYGKVRIR